MADSSRKPCRLEKLPWREIDGRAVIVHPSAGKVHELNAAATVLWNLADGSRTVGDLAQGLSEEFGISIDLARQDTMDFLRSLEGLGLLT